ncbi:MAG: hypothetical protein K2O38_07505 [Muribaculaceae bacterium]|nr:hypothetical protein [Muribaculaceae bacterium]
MKKFTLLALAAMAAGTQMGYADELPGGIITSTKENPVYYTIKNMRADRLSYINGEVYNADHDEVLMTDEALVGQGVNLPEYLPNEDETPEIWEFPYMGLAQCENKFWTAFSAMDEVMSPQTIYWWFEKAKTGNSVYIHNAVIDGALKNKAENVLGRPSMSFSETAKQAYYVLPLSEEQIADLGLEDDPFGHDAFALSKSNSLTDKNGELTASTQSSCLDMNNYITFNWTSDLQKVDENGDPVFNTVNKTDADGNVIIDPETGEPETEEVPVYVKYGFAGVDLTWNPLRQNGKNENHTYNNGSLFQVQKVDDVEAVNKAIEEYKQIVVDAYRAQVVDLLENGKQSVLSRIECLRNLPVIYNDTEKLDAIIASINNLTVDPSGVNTQADVDMWEDRIEQDMEAQYLRAMALAGNGTVIRLQQMFALRDWADYDGADEEENLGNAYLSSNGAGWAKYDGSMEEIGYPALTCLVDADETCDWTLEWVAGQGYRLKNGENYVRVRGDWEGLADYFYDALGVTPEDFDEEDNLFNHIDTNQMTWATTTDANEAAVFTFTANATEIQNVTLSDSEQEVFDSYGEELGYEDEDALFVTTNIAHLEAPDANGDLSYLCRDTAAQNYIVGSWNAGNRYFANPNCWKIEKVKEGEEIEDGIEEITVNAKAQGIYDLQGRKVAKASKGLYIINGVKTLVK